MIRLNYREFIKQVKQAAKVTDSKKGHKPYQNYVLVDVKRDGARIYATNDVIMWSSFCPASSDEEIKFFITEDQTKGLRVPKHMDNILIFREGNHAKIVFEDFEILCPIANEHPPYEQVFEKISYRKYTQEVTINAKLLRKILGGLDKVTFKFNPTELKAPVIIEDNDIGAINLIAPYIKI